MAFAPYRRPEGVFKCPVDQSALDYAKIYPAADTQQEVMAAKVRCVHHKEGCRWVDKLHGLQDHLAVCRYDAVPCPKECAAMLSRMCLSDHLQFTCPRRRVTCESCSGDFSGEAMETHQGSCPQEVMWCENKCGARLQRRYLSNHMRNECHKRTTPCPHCVNEFVYETLQNHYYQCPRFPITCPNRCDPAKIPREELDVHIRETCASATIPCSFREAGCNFKGARFNIPQHMEQSVQTHLQLMCTQSQEQQHLIADMSRQLQTLSRVTDGTFLWKIPGFKTKLSEAKATGKMELKSDAFYTSRYGYKLGASLFPDGNGSGEGTHLSLYIRVLQGEYDNLLEWPFRLPITFRVLDQCSDPEKQAHVAESFVPNPSWKHFQKPTKDVETMGFGYPKFVSQESLKTGGYVRDDALFVKISVDAGSFISP